MSSLLPRVLGELLDVTLALTKSTIMKAKNHQKQYIFGSLTRISDLQQHHFDVKELDRKMWETGDYVVGQYLGVDDKRIREKHVEELTNGTLQPLVKGDLVVGSFGRRAATQEVVGDWQLIGPDNIMHDIGGSGLFGRETSCSPFYFPSPAFLYQGHAVRGGRKIKMKDYVPLDTVPSRPPLCPTILLVGTSMSSGKTLTGRNILSLLQDEGFQRIVVTKLTGCGYYHDINSSSKDAYAVLDFVDVGLPSTVMPPESYRRELHKIFGMLSSLQPDCLVVELGASPWEPYNGVIVLEEIFQDTSCRPFFVLCASDAYAVIGFHTLLSEITSAKADVVCGIATNTLAGRKQIQEQTGIGAVCFEDEEGICEIRSLLKQHLATWRCRADAALAGAR